MKLQLLKSQDAGHRLVLFLVHHTTRATPKELVQASRPAHHSSATSDRTNLRLGRETAISSCSYHGKFSTARNDDYNIALFDQDHKTNLRRMLWPLSGRLVLYLALACIPVFLTSPVLFLDRSRRANGSNLTCLHQAT